MIHDKVVKNIEIKSPVSKVWNIITNPEMMKLWVVETPIEIESDWKVGSSIVIGGNIHGFNYKNKGTILQLEPEKVFEYNFWSEISRVPDIPENYSKIKYTLGFMTIMYKHMNKFYKTKYINNFLNTSIIVHIKPYAILYVHTFILLIKNYYHCILLHLYEIFYRS